MKTEVAPLPAPHPSGSEPVHEVCCADEQTTVGRVTMCGLPIPDHEAPADAMTSCVVCVDLIEQWARDADAHGERVPCRVCPRRT